MLKFLFSIFLFCSFLGSEEGKVINPVTDVCWDCLFPITISGKSVTPGSKDLETHNDRVCVCSGTPPIVGVPITFWEPAYVVDVTRHAYKLIGLGGVTIGKETVKNRGYAGSSTTNGSTSFYQTHLYKYPILSILGLYPGLKRCLENTKLDCEYFSELDHSWSDDSFSHILTPEAGLFGSSAAQLACMADCAASNTKSPLNDLFWCAGCQGSLYPLTGTISHHISGIQASSLILYRVLAKLHRTSILKAFRKGNFCEQEFLPLIKKDAYKTQLVYPIAQTKGNCHALGKSDVIWGLGKSYPKGGEDFVYLIWKKKQCCLDALEPALFGGGR